MKFIVNEGSKARTLELGQEVIGLKIGDVITHEGIQYKITGASTNTGNFHKKSLRFKDSKKCFVKKKNVWIKKLIYGTFLNEKTVSVNLLKI